MELSHIVAMSANRVIGNKGRMPWHIPEDFKIFKRITMGHALIMGRKTYESIGRPLPGRLNIVVTRQPDWAAPVGVLACGSVAAALQIAADAAAEWGSEVFVIGGGELYEQTLTAVGTVYQTIVPQQIEGDTYYPELPAAAFAVVQTEAGVGAVPFTWQVLKRRRL